MAELDGEMLEQILAAIHANGEALNDLKERMRWMEATLDVVMDGVHSHGSEIEYIKRSCNKRAEVCSAAFQGIRNELAGNGKDAGG